MRLTFKVAWRNIWRHKGKSLFIGVILFLGAFLMTLGNGIISGMNEGMARNIVHLFTGDIVIFSDDQEEDNVLLGSMSYKPLKIIKNYEEIVELLAEEEMIARFLPAAAGTVFLLDTWSEMSNYMLLGVDIDRYQEMFPGNFKVIEGRVFGPGERGILIPQETRVTSYRLLDFWWLPEGEELNKANLTDDARESIDNLEIRRDVVFMGLSPSGSFVDVKTPVTGIIEYRSLNKIWGHYCIVDIESFREAHNYVTGADSEVEIPQERKELLAIDDIEHLFAEDEVFTDIITTDGFTFEDIYKEVAGEERKYDLDTGTYNVVFVKLKEEISSTQALERLNRLFVEHNLPVRAVSWRDAVGTFGSVAVLFKGALNLFIMFVFFVAIIIIMNTLSMAALERISEIAMIRAIGGQRGFIRRMFVCETGILAFFFGGLGIILGVIGIYLLRVANITTENEFLQLVFGGNYLQPLFTGGDFIIGLIELGIVTALSVIYPLWVVGKIVPLDAIVRE